MTFTLQQYFLGVKAAGVYGWKPYHVHVPIVLKFGNLNLLEPSRPILACSGIALPFYIFVSLVVLGIIKVMQKEVPGL